MSHCDRQPGDFTPQPSRADREPSCSDSQPRHADPQLPRSDPQPDGHPESVPALGETPVLNAEALHQLERICERLGADRQRSPQMARQLVKRAGQLARERDWNEAQALEYLLSLMLNASGNGGGPQSPL